LVRTHDGQSMVPVTEENAYVVGLNLESRDWVEGVLRETGEGSRFLSIGVVDLSVKGEGEVWAGAREGAGTLTHSGSGQWVWGQGVGKGGGSI